MRDSIAAAILWALVILGLSLLAVCLIISAPNKKIVSSYTIIIRDSGAYAGSASTAGNSRERGNGGGE